MLSGGERLTAVIQPRQFKREIRSRGAMRNWLSLLLLIVVVGCAPVLTESRKETIRNVAVVSAIGDRITLTRTGLLVFSNEHQSENLDWNLDQVARQAVEQTLRERDATITIVPVSYDAKALSVALREPDSTAEWADPKRIEANLRQMTRGQQVDTIIVIARGRRAFNSGSIRFEGPGISTMRTLRDTAPVKPFAALELFVIDAPTMKVLSQTSTMTEGIMYNVNPVFGSPGPQAPFRPGFNFPMDGDQKAFLRPVLEPVVAKAVRNMMQDVGLGAAASANAVDADRGRLGPAGR